MLDVQPKKRDVLQAENDATKLLKKLVTEAVIKEQKPITVYIGNRIITDVVDVDNKHIRGDPKADIALISDKGINVGFISHKKEGGAKAFQQYGGMSAKSGSKIYNSPIVSAFVRDLESHVQEKFGNNTFQSGNAIYRLIPNDVEGQQLLSLSIYGPEWSKGSRYSLQSVHCIGQGSPILNRNINDGSYVLKFSDKMHIATDLRWAFTGDFAGVLGVTYRGGRRVENSGYVVRSARAGIYPLQFMKNRSSIQI